MAKLVYSFGALCKLEKITGLTVSKAMETLASNPSMSMLRDIYIAGRYNDCPDIKNDEAEKEIDSIISAGGVEELVKLIQEAFEESALVKKKTV